MPQTAIAACNLVSAAAGAAQANTAILTPPATPGLQTVWLAGLTIYGSGATAATVVTATLAGITGGNQLFQINVPAGANTGAFQFFLQFDPPLEGVLVRRFLWRFRPLGQATPRRELCYGDGLHNRKRTILHRLL